MKCAIQTNMTLLVYILSSSIVEQNVCLGLDLKNATYNLIGLLV